MAKQSWFAEITKSSHDPQFFNRREVNIERNVKRIITDIKDNLITDDDYIFFGNENVIKSCMSAAAQAAKRYYVLSDACDLYHRTNMQNFALSFKTIINPMTGEQTLIPEGYINTPNSAGAILAAQMQNEARIKYTIWNIFLVAFNEIAKRPVNFAYDASPKARADYIAGVKYMFECALAEVARAYPTAYKDAWRVFNSII